MNWQSNINVCKALKCTDEQVKSFYLLNFVFITCRVFRSRINVLTVLSIRGIYPANVHIFCICNTSELEPGIPKQENTGMPRSPWRIKAHTLSFQPQWSNGLNSSVACRFTMYKQAPPPPLPPPITAIMVNNQIFIALCTLPLRYIDGPHPVFQLSFG